MSKFEKQDVKRDGGLPWVSYLMFVILTAVYAVLYILIISWLYRKWDVGSVNIIATLSVVVSLIVGFFVGAVALLYGHRSLGYAWGFVLLIVALLSAFDYWFFTKFIVQYVDSYAYMFGCMAVSLSAEILMSVISYMGMLKSNYCPRCDMANMIEYSHKENEESNYRYKFKTHHEHEETTTIREGGASYNTYKVTYTVPGYQENLGLHKYTKYDEVYCCIRCGYVKKQKISTEEKVE